MAIKLTGAGVERIRKGLVYELEGTLRLERYEIEVTETGKVVEVEKDDDEGSPLRLDEDRRGPVDHRHAAPVVGE